MKLWIKITLGILLTIAIVFTILYFAIPKTITFYFPEVVQILKNDNRVKGASESGFVYDRLIKLPPADDSITIGFVGDIIPDDIPNNEYLSPLKNIFDRADIMMGNLEGVLIEKSDATKLEADGTEIKCKVFGNGCYMLRGNISFARVLADNSFDFVNLANNHAQDYGATGIANTKLALDTWNILYSGERNMITTKEINGTKVAFVGFSPNIGSNLILSQTEIKNVIYKAKKETPIVVVVFHAGGEGRAYKHTLAGEEFYFGENRGDVIKSAHTAIDAGADLILASGPHVLRGMEVYHNRLVAYSLGNFYATHDLNTKEISGTSGILLAQIKKDSGEFSSGLFFSTQLDDSGIPQIDETDVGLSAIKSLSFDDFPSTMPNIQGDGTIVKK